MVRWSRQVALLAGLTVLGSAASAQTLTDVPRTRTLISQGWDLYNQVPSPTNLSPYNGILLHERNSLHYTVNEMLFYTNHNTNQVIPWQAKSWSYSPDFRQLTINLRDGVKWSDGQPFTADDVVFTFDMLRGAAPEMVFSSAMKEWVAKTEAVDPLTVRVTLTKPGPRWAEDFLATGQTTRFIVVPKHVWQGKDPKTFGDFDLVQGWPVGTGPYKVVRSDSGAIVFDRRPTWWAVETGLAKAMPAPERVIYRPATTEALPQLFAGNEIDMGRALPVGAFEAARARNPNLVSWNRQGPVWGAPDGCQLTLSFNVQTPPFNDVAVRQAIASVVDRDQISDLSFEGAWPTVLGPFSQLMSLRAYTDQIADVLKAAGPKPDRARAAVLLTGRGYARGGDGRWQMPGGKTWPLTVLAQQSDPIAPVLARQLQAAGFDAVFSGAQDTGYFQALTSGNYGMAITDQCGSLYDPWQTLEHFHSKYAASPGKDVAGPRTISRYANPEYDTLIDAMEARQPSPEDPAYMALVKQATEILLRDVPQVALIDEEHAVTFNTTYWKGWPSAADPYVAPYQAWEGFARALDHLQPAR